MTRLRLRALRSIRLNYTRRGTLRWLWARHRAALIGRGYRPRGFERVWRDPEKVIQEQHALAEGAYS